MVSYLNKLSQVLERFCSSRSRKCSVATCSSVSLAAAGARNKGLKGGRGEAIKEAASDNDRRRWPNNSGGGSCYTGSIDNKKPVKTEPAPDSESESESELDQSKQNVYVSELRTDLAQVAAGSWRKDCNDDLYTDDKCLPAQTNITDYATRTETDCGHINANQNEAIDLFAQTSTDTADAASRIYDNNKDGACLTIETNSVQTAMPSLRAKSSPVACLVNPVGHTADKSMKQLIIGGSGGGGGARSLLHPVTARQTAPPPGGIRSKYAARPHETSAATRLLDTSIDNTNAQRTTMKTQTQRRRLVHRQQYLHHDRHLRRVPTGAAGSGSGGGGGWRQVQAPPSPAIGVSLLAVASLCVCLTFVAATDVSNNKSAPGDVSSSIRASASLATAAGSLLGSQQPSLGADRLVFGGSAGGAKRVDWVDHLNELGSRLLTDLIPPAGWFSPTDLPTNRRDRWAYVPSGMQTHETRDRYRYPEESRNPITRAVNRIRQRIGSRNSIRVHNAFRDFAWRLLSRLSMPTPVIYELRRQNFYPIDDDLMNDSLHDKNTTKTIRTRRNLFDEFLHKHRRRAASARRRAADDYDEDDDEPESFRDRLRMRFDDLLSLSRRNLFGANVIRVPSLFPFKRQQQDSADSADSDEDGADGDSAPDSASSGGINLAHKLVRNHKRGRSLLSSRKRRPGAGRQRKDKDADRQKIFINGKKYYVDDDTGELKEVKEPASAGAAKDKDTDETYAGNNNNALANQRSDKARK